MKYSASTVTEYLTQIPPERKSAIQPIRKAIKSALPSGYQELIQYGMITYAVPLKRYPAGYLEKSDTPVPFLSIASQKNHMAIYLMCVYGKEEENFRKRYRESGKKLDMGKCCIRFKKLEDLALDAVCEEVRTWTVDRFLNKYEQGRMTAKKSSKGKPFQVSNASLNSAKKRPGEGKSPQGSKASPASVKKKSAKKSVARNSAKKKSAKKTFARKKALRV
ncbi:MAG TPA: DUF1801 domain-containing protein [Leptospiraceae bacterium]|nr:hypothetical protein [Spirochaetaceae bacterium]HBS06292.1 DUF1801 domain-containing protein [Leptospiraceae bacterium]|tara:strand:- start:15505 stop:16164 length:660 start_codon:yes stop_codon:yes gene_type:complete